MSNWPKEIKSAGFGNQSLQNIKSHAKHVEYHLQQKTNKKNTCL